MTERRLLKGMGATPHSNSGAGRWKEDGHTDDHLVEIKDAIKSFTLKAADLEATHVRALRQSRRGLWLIYFADRDFTAEIRLVPGGRELLG